MADTTFSQGTLIESTWLNDVNDAIYQSNSAITGSTDRTAVEKLADIIFAEDYGVVGDGVEDDTAAIQAAIEAAYGKKLRFKGGRTYIIGSTIDIDESIEIEAEGGHAIWETDFNTGVAVAVGDNVAVSATTTLTANISINEKVLTLASTTGIAVGDLLRLTSTKAWYHDPRTASLTVEADATGTAQAGSSTTLTLKAGTTSTNFVGKSFTITSGSGVGFSATVTAYDTGTKVCTFTAVNTTFDNTSVYRFPEAFKSELHRVRRVINGTTLEIEAQTFDGYDVVNDAFGDAQEVVNITAYTPIKVSIKGIHIQRPAGDGYDSFGFTFNNTVDSILDDVIVENGTSSSIRLTFSYRPKLLNSYVHGANRDTTGYGIQTSGATFPEISNCTFLNCRRGVDFSGSIVVTSFGLADNNIVVGGGLQEDGQEYTPQGSIENFGLGTHGATRNCTFKNNRIGNVSRGINLRGRNARIINNEFFGDMALCCIDLSTGCNTHIEGNTYNNMFSEGSLTVGTTQIEDSSFEATNLRNKQCLYFIRVQSTYERGTDIVVNNSAHQLGLRFLFFDFDSGTQYDWSVCENNMFFFPATSSHEVGLVGCEGGTVNLANWTCRNNHMQASAAATDVFTYGTGITVAGSAVPASVSDLGTAWSYTVYIEDDDIAKLRIFQQGDYAKLWVESADVATFRFIGYVLKDSASLTSIAANDFEGLAAAPTAGASGGTDGRLQVHYGDTWLTLKNRTGTSRNFDVTIFPKR